ncbi:DUF262 domain-containing protein [Marinicella gelatinilytica]|uniref:DUF262 domain-containing protein n=1 Tax=Marinicella gelatinilytica TaxID=2996017 RepID=UPI002260A415|nr:DUF262 domain-containing protein [Marinicella gelatinilytica]MCX7545659.1 DUF262 domain-containing protein [Marinicella gelatinilytica]
MNNVIVSQIDLPTLFNNNYFYIPDYQRGYSWENEHRQALLDDILSTQKHLTDSQYKHFMGTIVAVNKQDEKNYDIVDGQQRLTTIILLIHSFVTVFENILKPDEIDRLNNLYLYRNNKQVFQSGLQEEILADVLSRSLYSQQAKIKQDQNIIDAINQFIIFFNSKRFNSENGENILKPHEFLNILENKLGFIFFVPKTSKTAGRMFEVINNRGKNLSELDKIKNYFVYIAEDENYDKFLKKINNKWGTILRNIQEAGFETIQEENEFLRSAWIVFGSPIKKNSYKVYQSLKDKTHNKKIRSRYCSDFFDFLVFSSQSLSNLFQAKLDKNKPYSKLDSLYEKLSVNLNINKSSMLPLVLSVFAITDSKDNFHVELLELIEIFNFRYYILQIANRNDSNQADLLKWAHWLYTKKDENGNSFSEPDLKALLIAFLSTKTKDKQFIEKLATHPEEETDFYRNWNRGLLFLLSRYELDLRITKDKRKTYSLKEIIPKRQKIKTNNHSEREHIWSKEFNPANMNISVPKTNLTYLIEFNKKRLGNFTLLSRSENSVNYHLPILNKMEIYRNSDYMLNKKLVEIAEEYFSYVKHEENFSYKGVNFKGAQGQDVLNYSVFLDIWESKLINFALKEWAVPNLNSNNARNSQVEINSFKYKELKPCGEKIYKLID